MVKILDKPPTKWGKGFKEIMEKYEKDPGFTIECYRNDICEELLATLEIEQIPVESLHEKLNVSKTTVTRFLRGTLSFEAHFEFAAKAFCYLGYRTSLEITMYRRDE